MRGRTVATLLASLGLSLLAGCGPEETPQLSPSVSPSAPTDTPTRPADPEELLALAMENTWKAPSKRLSGTVVIAAAGQTKAFDYVYVGSLAHGTQTDAAPEGNSAMEVVKIGDDVYIRTDAVYWQWYVPLEQLKFVVGKWVKARYEDYPSTVPGASTTVTPPRREVTRVGTDTVGGTEVVVLSDGAGSRYLVDEDGPYLLRFAGVQDTPIGTAAVDIEFSQIGAVTEVIAAPGGEIVDLYNLPKEAKGGH